MGFSLTKTIQLLGYPHDELDTPISTFSGSFPLPTSPSPIAADVPATRNRQESGQPTIASPVGNVSTRWIHFQWVPPSTSGLKVKATNYCPGQDKIKLLRANKLFKYLTFSQSKPLDCWGTLRIFLYFLCTTHIFWASKTMSQRDVSPSTSDTYEQHHWQVNINLYVYRCFFTCIPEQNKTKRNIVLTGCRSQ